MTTRPPLAGRTRTLLGGLVMWAACSAPNPLYVTGSLDGGREVLPAGGGGGGLPNQGQGGSLANGGAGGSGGNDGSGGNGGSGGQPTPGTGGMPVDPNATGGAGGVAPGTGGVAPGTGGAAGTGGGGMPLPDGGSPADVVVTPDLPAAELGQPSPTCGTSHFNVASITGARGIAVDADGTVYFTREVGTAAWIGRVTPAGIVDPTWRSLPANSQPRTLRVDSARHLVYVPSMGINIVYAVGIALANFAYTYQGVPTPHGVALGDDGFAYVSKGDGHIERVSPDLVSGNRSTASTEPIFPAGQRPMGMIFGPGGHLFIGSDTGSIRRYRLEAGKLVEGTAYGNAAGPVTDLAVDIEGRLFVAGYTGTTARPLYQVPAGGFGPAVLLSVTGRLTGLAFGRGPFACQDLYIGSDSEVTRVWSAPLPGLRAP